MRVRTREQDAVTPSRRLVRVRAVQKPIVEDDGVAGVYGNRRLVGMVGHRRMVDRDKIPVLVGIRQDTVQRVAATVGTGYDAKRTCPGICVGQVAQNGDLCCGPAPGERVIPAPPILMPRKRRALWILHRDVARDPSQIRCLREVSQLLPAPGISQSECDDWIVPPDVNEPVMRTVAARHRRRLQCAVYLSAERRNG